jgi:toxin CptA
MRNSVLSKKHEPPLLLALKPSERLKQLIVFIHVLALAACAANSLPIAVKLGLSAAICVHLWLTVKRLKREHHRIKHTETLGWEASSSSNDLESVRILNSTVITPFAIFLHIRSQNAGKQAMLVLSDALSEDDYRRLIVKLKTSLPK